MPPLSVGGNIADNGQPDIEMQKRRTVVRRFFALFAPAAAKIQQHGRIFARNLAKSARKR